MSPGGGQNHLDRCAGESAKKGILGGYPKDSGSSHRWLGEKPLQEAGGWEADAGPRVGAAGTPGKETGRQWKVVLRRWAESGGDNVDSRRQQSQMGISQHLGIMTS